MRSIQAILANRFLEGCSSALGTILLACSFLLALTTSGLANDAELSGRLQRIAADSQLNGSVIVTRGGSPLMSRGFGYANREHEIKNTELTKHRIGSNTKQFTAMAILILESRGKLRVEDVVAKHVPDVPVAWRPLTIHQLLTHTSGLRHSWSVPRFAQNAGQPHSLDETLEIFYGLPLLFKPGSDFTYSGTGYFLLAKVIEQVSGKSYAEFLREEIFVPLKMFDSGVDEPEVILKSRASGYDVNQSDEIVNSKVFYMPMLTGGGNLYSTVEDLSRWDRALHDRRLIPKASYEKMFQPEKKNYAYGWIVTSNERKAISHSGGVSGFSSFVLRYPDEEVFVAVLSNHRSKKVRQIAQRLAGEVLETIDSDKQNN
tara:strand:+ start:18470 stop:19588 length:1119 start_codon:yes stop_codon:yes gene_type:complete